MKSFTVNHLLGACAAIATLSPSATAAVFSVTIDGSDAIFLAGRTDVVIPPANEAWGTLGRHGGATPEETLETLPSSISVVGGDVVKVADPAVGGINFFNGFGPPFFGPSGNGATGSSLTSLGGISGYTGPQGPLTGVFLDDSVPSAAPPTSLDFSPSSLGIDFASLSPGLGQVFYIGDGVTAAAEFQQFIAPAGATRLFLGIPDGFGFGGAPGAYDDNDGSYRIRLGINEDPNPPDTSVPEGGSSIILFGLGLLGMAGVARRARP